MSKGEINSRHRENKQQLFASAPDGKANARSSASSAISSSASTLASSAQPRSDNPISLLRLWAQLLQRLGALNSEIHPPVELRLLFIRMAIPLIMNPANKNKEFANELLAIIKNSAFLHEGAKTGDNVSSAKFPTIKGFGNKLYSNLSVYGTSHTTAILLKLIALVVPDSQKILPEAEHPDIKKLKTPYTAEVALSAHCENKLNSRRLGITGSAADIVEKLQKLFMDPGVLEIANHKDSKAGSSARLMPSPPKPVSFQRKLGQLHVLLFYYNELFLTKVEQLSGESECNGIDQWIKVALQSATTLEEVQQLKKLLATSDEIVFLHKPAREFVEFAPHLKMFTSHFMEEISRTIVAKEFLLLSFPEKLEQLQVLLFTYHKLFLGKVEQRSGIDECEKVRPKILQILDSATTFEEVQQLRNLFARSDQFIFLHKPAQEVVQFASDLKIFTSRFMQEIITAAVAKESSIRSQRINEVEASTNPNCEIVDGLVLLR